MGKVITFGIQKRGQRENHIRWFPGEGEKWGYGTSGKPEGPALRGGDAELKRVSE